MDREQRRLESLVAFIRSVLKVEENNLKIIRKGMTSLGLCFRKPIQSECRINVFKKNKTRGRKADLGNC